MLVVKKLVLKQNNALQKLLLNYCEVETKPAKMPKLRDIIKKLIVMGNYSILYESKFGESAIEILFEHFDADTKKIIALYWVQYTALFVLEL